MNNVILHPCALDDKSEKQLSYVSKLCKVLNSPLKVIHTYRLPVLYSNLQNLKSEAKELEGSLRKKVTELTKGIEHEEEPLIIQGEPMEGIVKACKKVQPKLIVMGTRGDFDLQSENIDSVTSEIIGKSDYPVWVIPNNVVYREIKHILIATDFEDFNENVLYSVCSMAEKFGARITILNISESTGYFNEEKLKVYHEVIYRMQEHDNISLEILQDENLAQALYDFMDEKSVDLLVITKRNHHLVDSRFKYSFAKELMVHSNRAFIVYPKN